jgi:hypothetical protein
MRQHSSRRIDILSEPLKQATPISPTRSISRSSIGDIVQCIIEAPYPKDTSLSSSACYSGTSALRAQPETGVAEIDAPRMQPKNEGCAIMQLAHERKASPAWSLCSLQARDTQVPFLHRDSREELCRRWRRNAIVAVRSVLKGRIACLRRARSSRCGGRLILEGGSSATSIKGISWFNPLLTLFQLVLLSRSLPCHTSAGHKEAEALPEDGRRR